MAKKQFKAESKRLLDLMINSIYTHKEIFLREIISNASDACDKLCYLALTDDSVGMDRKDFQIELSVDKASRIITVSDNGIGMNREDLENHLGVIASSGSYKFKQEVGEDAKDTEVIGQFGVGFYSAFMVADQITVVTRKYGAESAYTWKSSGADGYTITECEKDTVGTDIRGGHPQLHGAHLAAEQVLRHHRGVPQVLPGQVPRLQRSTAGDLRVRGGFRHLQGTAVRPRRHAL